MTKTPTTFEMDGLFEQEDIDNRFFLMIVCVDCGKWNKQDNRERVRKPCIYCGSKTFDNQSNHWYSLRTWNPLKKISAKERKAKG